MMCGDGKESIRPVKPSGPVILGEYPAESKPEIPDPLKKAIKEALGVHRS
jgi:hypothetical protein